MPIFYNFHILLATFYTIFGTNILIQCPVPVPVCCMFFVSQNIHIKRTPNAIKIYGELFWNICDFWEVEYIIANGGPQPPQDTWARQAAQARGGGLCPPHKLAGAILRAQGSLYPEKIVLKSQRNRSYGSEYKKQFSTRSGERETEENIEGDPISEGLLPLPHHGDHGPEGELSSHLRGRSRKKKKEGLSLPLSPGGAGTPLEQPS